MTIFRQALAPRVPARASAWATRDVYMGHFAITDVDGAGGARRFHAYERFARDGLALAGARARPFAVWVDDWRMQGPRAADGPMPVHLSARDDDGAAIDLDVGVFGAGHAAGAGQPIAEGDRGLSVKGPAPGKCVVLLLAHVAADARPRDAAARGTGGRAGQLRGLRAELDGPRVVDRARSAPACAAGTGWACTSPTVAT